jgi:dCTP deaminase
MSASGILSDLSICEAVDKGEIEIAPFDPAQLNPASYDLRLGSDAAVYTEWIDYNRGRAEPRDHALDVKSEPSVTRWTIDEKGIELRPGVGYLLATAETVFTRRYVGVVDGKSSLGRLFVLVHCTAGYIDPNFRGNVTLEVTVTHPVRLYAGMRIAQIRFHTVHGEIGRLYDGNYKGDTSRGPVASRAWKQFDK